MSKFISLILSLFFFFTFFIQVSSAQEMKQAVLVNPVRGGDFWTHNFSITETPKKQYEIIKNHSFPSTWLIRYDALLNPEVTQFIKSLDSSQDIGIFFEVTPSLTNASGVKYNDTGNWHFAKSVLLTGYSPDDRKKLIDTAFNKFKEVTGGDPKSVGAWWIDAGSLSYIKEKYDIEANLDVADQYSTDGYQVWGQYWSTPFYPSKVNGLMPAQSEEMKLGVVTMQWATRDPFNGFGNGVFESTYSVQANDYMLHDLDTQYFSKLLDIYPQTTIGLENDFDWNQFGKEFENQLNAIKQKQQTHQIQVRNMLQFANYYKAQNPDISPNVIISADDPLGGTGKVVWLNTPKYRMAWFYNQNGSYIRDLRKFNDRGEESCLNKACDELKLAYDAISAIDDGNYSSNWILDEGQISDIKVSKLGYGVQIDYKNQAGVQRQLKFLENDVEFNGKIDTLDTAILKTVTAQNSVKPVDESFESKLDIAVTAKNFSINLGKFVLLVLLFFFIPGFAFIRSKLLAIPIGIALFTLLSWGLGFVKQDTLIWGLPIISLGYIIYRDRKVVWWRFTVSKRDLVLSALVLLGSISWMITQFKNGLVFNYGLGFWGPNGHDAIWHLSLIGELQKNVPPQNPIFAGSMLTNYHYFFDLLVAKSANILWIDPLDLLFRLFPLLISILTGVLIFKVTEKISHSFKASILSVFFLYFGGSFGWILTFIKDKSFAGETTFWAQQSISTLLNPPFAISLVTLLAGLVIFYDVISQKFQPKRLIIPLTLLWGTLIEFKAYAGILVLGALGLYTLQRLIIKRDWNILLVSVPVLILSLIVFLPNNSGSESLINFQPLWLIDQMIEAPDRLGWHRLTLTLDSGVWYKLIYGYTLGTIVFLLGNFGTRIVSLAAIKDFFKQSFLFYFFILAVIFPLLFIQKGNGWNIIQFFYYGLLVLNIFAGIGLYNLVKKIPRSAGVVVVLAVVILTVPTTLGTFQHYLPQRPPTILSAAEFEALKFLQVQSEGYVLALPYDEKLGKLFNAPRPLAVYNSTAYVSAFSGKPVFMEDTINLEILGIDNKARLNTVRDFMKVKAKSHEILKSNNISYFYLPTLYNFQVDEGLMGLKVIFENKEVKVYKVI